MLPVLIATFAAGIVLAYEVTLGFNSAPQVETRTIKQIYDAALKEGGVVTCWHGGDEKNSQVAMKRAFEQRFPGIKLNLTVDFSKYHNGNLDAQLAANNVYVDSIILQTLHDYPRWAQQGALLNYAPLGFDQIYPAYKDSLSATWYGIFYFAWQFIWNSKKAPGLEIREFADFFRPEWKNKLILTYPNDDDAVLFTFYQIMQQYGTAWFDKLLQQNPTWVRGAASPALLLERNNNTLAATFTSSVGFAPPEGIKISFPSRGQFTSWPQTGAILRNAPHPEGAKLLHSFLLSSEYQKTLGWSVRRDIGVSTGFRFPDILQMQSTNPTLFSRFMADRAEVERVRFWFESKLGTPQGISPLVDDIN